MNTRDQNKLELLHAKATFIVNELLRAKQETDDVDVFWAKLEKTLEAALTMTADDD